MTDQTEYLRALKKVKEYCIRVWARTCFKPRANIEGMEEGGVDGAEARADE